MKKLRWISILMLLVLLFAACGDAPAEEKVSISDMYFVWDSHRINVSTGAVTPLCPDPLCEHTLDVCPYYGIFFPAGNVNVRSGQYFLFYGKKLTENENSKTQYDTTIKRSTFASYDITSNTVTHHYQSAGKLFASYSRYDHYVFLRALEAEDDIQNPTAEDFETNSIIIDLSDNSQKRCPDFSDRMLILHYDGNLICYLDVAYQYHILDITSGENRIVTFEDLPEELREKGYYYYSDGQIDDENIGTVRGIYHMKPDGVGELIVPDGYGYLIRDNDIIYIKYDSSVQNDRHSWDIWACDLDGGNPRIVFENPGNIRFYSSINQDAQLAGNYLGIECTEVTTNEAGETVALHSMSGDGYTSFLIIDTTTGEYRTVAVPHMEESVTISAQ